MLVHKSLYEREKLLGGDVKDALERIVTEDGKNLPLAITKSEVVNRLMIMSSIDKNGLHHQRNARDQKSGAERFLTDLQTTSVFMAGAELYERATKNPVIPVTDYFFNHVYDANGGTRECLDAMSETEIANSLPRRAALPQAPGLINLATGKPTKIPIHQASPPAGGHLIYTGEKTQQMTQVAGGSQLIQTTPSGRVAGVVIFPSGEAETGLVASWYARRMSVTTGNMDRVIDLLEHIVGDDDERIAALRRHGADFKSTAKIARELAPEQPEPSMLAKLRA